MKDSKNYKLQPAVIGVFICVFLVISRFLGNSGSSTGLLSLNTLVIIAVLCLCLHLVRRTSSLFQSHVWNSPWTLCLLIMPLMNLLVTGVQLITDITLYFNSHVFNAILILLSMPVFMCVYFSYIVYKLPQNKQMKALGILLDAVGVIYVVFRLFSVIIFPVLVDSGKEINIVLNNVFSHFPEISLIIYFISVICFFVSAGELSGNSQKKNLEQ